METWECELEKYWDKQLLQLTRFRFPLNCHLAQYTGNHGSANECSREIEAYVIEEASCGTLLGLFDKNPIPGGHCSSFMTGNKPNSDKHHIIVDLSWPQGASVNAGIDKTSYIDSEFSLTSPTVDDITSELKSLWRGTYLYKVDVSWEFHHIRVDPGDYYLVGLQWKGHCVDTEVRTPQ